MIGDQLCLLLWKNYVVRKRNPGMLALVLLWPVLVFLVLYAVRDNTDPEYNPTCQFPARLMPQNEFLPFLQNFICTLGNPCKPLSEYEEVPSYKNAKLGPLLNALQPMIKNETTFGVVKALPKSIKFFKSMAEVLTRPGVKKIFERGISLGDLFSDHDEIRDLIQREVPNFSPVVVDNILNASIKLQYLAAAFGSSNMDGIICTPESLKQFLILETDEDLLKVSKALCSLNSTLIPELLQRLTEQLDFNGLFSMVNLVMAKFSSYDIFRDLQQTADSILSLRMVDLHVPKKLRLQEWLPKIIPLFRNVTFKEINLSFITDAINLLDPIFQNEANWPIARNGFLKLNLMLQMVKNTFQNNSIDPSTHESVFTMTENILTNLNTSFHSYEAVNVGKILDAAWEVLLGGTKLTKILLSEHQGDIEVTAEVFDSLRNFFPKKIMNNLSYLISLTDVIVQATHHVATLHFETSKRIWDIAQNHTSLVRSILMTNPTIYRKIVESLSQLDIVENFLEINKGAGEVFCDQKMLQKIINDSKDSPQDYRATLNILCSEEGKKFLTEIYDSFNFKNFEHLVQNMLDTFVYGAIGLPVPMSTSNLTTVIRSVKKFVLYLETPKSSKEPDWKIFAPSSTWSDTHRNMSPRGRLDILAIHLSIAKKVGLRSLSFGTIKPSLTKMDYLAETLVRSLKNEPMDWVKEVDEDVPQLVNAFYLTAANRSKVLNIFEISNFTHAYCKVSDPPHLIIYPKGTNETRLKRRICQISEYIEGKIHYGSENERKTSNFSLSQNSFDWTDFNKRVITIYSHIDRIIHIKYPEYNFTERQELKDLFITSWTKNITSRDGWEISVALLCKLGEILDSRLYEFMYHQQWETIKLWATAFSKVFQTIEDRITIIMDKNGTSSIGLNLMPETEIFEEIVLRNIKDGVNDVADLLTLKMQNLSAIIEYKTHETDWPCLKKQSVGEILDVRNGTRKIIRQIERIACNPGFFINEWKQLFDIHTNGDRNYETPFDWTGGYKKFRRLVANLTKLSWESSIILDEPKISFNDVQNVFKHAIRFVKSKFTDLTDWNNVVTSLDNKLNDLVSRNNYSTWSTDEIQNTKHDVDIPTRFSVLAKYGSHVIYQILTVASDILNKGPKTDAFSILGFTDKSPIKIAYSHLPDLTATFITGLSSSSIMKKISSISKNPYGGPTCADVFHWFAEFRQEISPDDYTRLKNGTCDLDPINFNAFTDLLLNEGIVRTMPVKDYPLYAGRTILRMYEFGRAVKNAVTNGLKIKSPFTSEYWDAVGKKLTHDLKAHRTPQQIRYVDSENTLDVAVEFIAELLRHVAGSLQKIGIKKVPSGKFYLWDLVEDGDVRQLLKILEAHPSESISLAATIARFDPTLAQPMLIRDLQHNMCDRHFGTGFWNNTEKINFLKRVCSFDPHQLLKSATSQEFYDLMYGPRSKVQRELSLSEYLADAVEAFSNLSKSQPDLTFKSNIFNITIWKGLDNDTWSIIQDTERSWLHYYFDKMNIEKLSNDRHDSISDDYKIPQIAQNLNGFDYIIQSLSLSFDLFFGGDIWSKLRAVYESKPVMKVTLSMAEDMPNLMLSVVHTFFNKEIQTSDVTALVMGKVKFCEVNKYLIEPKYMRRKGLLGSFSHLCQQLRNYDARDIIPIDASIPTSLFFNRNESNLTFGRSETLILNHIKQLQSLIIKTMAEGFKDFRLPAYWTSFMAGNFKDFLTEYESMDPQSLVNMTARQISAFLESMLEIELGPAGRCSWCGSATNLLHTLNTQLSQHETYATLICLAEELDFAKIRVILFDKLNWKGILNKVNQIQTKGILNKDIRLDDVTETSSVPAFSAELNNTLHYLAEIAFRFSKVNNSVMYSCVNHKFDGSRVSKPTTYVNVFRILLTLIYENVYLLDTAYTHKKLSELGKMAEKTTLIWLPVVDTVLESDVNEVDELLHGALINVNMLTTDIVHNEKKLYEILVSKQAKYFLQYSNTSFDIPSTSDVSQQLAKSLNSRKIQGKIAIWRYEATTQLYWLKDILKNLEMIAAEAGHLLDVASGMDFSKDLSQASDSLEEVIQLLREETIDKFFDGFNELLDHTEPFISDPIVKDDLRTVLSTLESMEIFKNLGLLNTKYAIKEMFPNWPNLRSYLTKTLALPGDVTKALSGGKVNMLSVYSKERQAVSLTDTICSPEKLGEIIEFKGDETMIEEISASLCQLSSEQIQSITISLIKKLKFGTLFKDIMSASVKNILSNANLNEKEGVEIINNLGFAAKLVPLLKDAVTNMSDQFSADYLVANETESFSPSEKISFGKFLSDTGEMLCGQPVVEDTGRFYKVISNIRENGQEFNEDELTSLPNDFCRDTYKEISRIGAGKIVWSYVKPLLRGRILYTPQTKIIDSVMKEVNSTFFYIENFGILIDSFAKSMSALANLTELGDDLTDLNQILASDLMKIAVKSLSGPSLATDLANFDLGKLAWRMKNSHKLVEIVQMLNRLMDCVLTDRVIGFASEKELEEEAGRLMKTNDFLAGVVFMDESPVRIKRSYVEELPENITYKIRMDVDSVPSTSRLKNQFWTPGPDSSFIENLRYLRGFIQLQDSIDRALIKAKTQTELEWQTVSQQMPYPCWKFFTFQSSLYESQGLQVCFFFALMVCVGAAVRHIVWERESQNAMVMSVMGLKPWRNTFAWFITSMIELSIVAICIHIILITGKILPHSDPVLVLFLLLDYVFASVTFCYMISTMFSSASLAAVTTVVMFLLTYMPYIIVIAMEASVKLTLKLLLCLSMSTSFCYGCLFAVRLEVQGIGLTWDAVWKETSPGDSMSLGLVLLTIAFDGCLYALIGYLVTKYTNSGRGFYGLRSISLWWADTRSFYGRPSYLAFENQVYFTNDAVELSASTHEDVGGDTSSLHENDEKQTGVRFDEVRKVYQTESGECVAVDDFSIKLMEGEVTTLLGRNGAGKTTVIKMLTGMEAPTSGQIWLPNSSSNKPNIGVCPQNNVLIGCLTAREHMIFYARLKNNEVGYDMDRDIDTMLTSMELNGQEDELVYRLSGGTQRRLCVCLAFLGSPTLVILDEPGAGVDPAARRRIWRLIDKHRIGRTVLLSTHHMDEADMLSDTVVIMHKGKILCSGSPLSLKSSYGHGYKITVCFPLQDSRTRTIKERRDDSQMVSEHLETLMTVLEEVVPNTLLKGVSNSEVNIIIPFQRANGIANDMVEVMKILEDNQHIAGFSHFNVECDTLERIFLDMCTHADSGQMYPKPTSLESLNSISSIGLANPPDDVDLIDHEPKMPQSVIRQGKALLKKRWWHFSRDWCALLAALVLPTLFVAVAMGFSLIRPPSDNQPPLSLTPELYNAHPLRFYSIDNTSDKFHGSISLQLHNRFGDDYAGAWQTSPNDKQTCKCLDGDQVCYGLPPPYEGLIETFPGRPTLDWIVSTQQQYIERRYGGWSLSHMEPENKTGLFVVWYNNKGHHSLPAYINALNEAIFKANGASGHLTTINHPIKLSRDQLNRTSLLQHVADVGVALVLLVAFSLVGAQGAKELVRERLSEEKRIFYLAGVRPLTYWTTALIWDILVFAVSILLAVIVFEIFGLPAYVARDNLSSVCVILFLYAWAVIPFTHLAEKIFDDASLSNMVLFCLNTFIGVSSLATILIIDILGKTKTAEDFRNFLHQLLLIFPQYALGDGLVQMSKNDITASLLERFHMNTYKSPLSWELLGPHCLYLFAVGAILFVINLVVECRTLPDIFKQKVVYRNSEEDEDVARERIRVEKGLCNDVLKTINLRKEYKSVAGKNVAVQDLSFGIQAGECFGLFGVNGAGKSTTFKMLTTEIIPTAGEVVINDKEVGSGPLCSGDLGYCPQSNALDPFLTPHQSLTIHGEICGLRNVPRAVELSMKRFDLIKYAHQRVANLSGGNKRKLCAAISTMAPTQVVLMDEATSGMDPAAKYLVARAVKSILKNQGSVLITSHSVAECEDLCTRVGVLAKAGLKCIGSPQYLKHKYGEGYIVSLRFKSPTCLTDLLKAIATHLPGTSIASRQALAARFLVPRNHDMKLSTVFAKVKDLARELNDADYTLTQSSLDQVLVNLSEESDDERNFEHGSSSDSQLYLNLGAIHMNTMRRERFTPLPIS
ncbi:uncharacterized protein ldd isoform X1 [Neodiprion pinetum]|uniref:uncharacterized protein ldd isoform X1 n=1 Tax=Neodiprion pinetum TaxID=441929 RepID=UPI001EDE62A6|nr:uncharacterized protein LOC124223361 isoform X1 [Neodiprion pinetum]